jgi:hypothetical protein
MTTEKTTTWRIFLRISFGLRMMKAMMAMTMTMMTTTTTKTTKKATLG